MSLRAHSGSGSAALHTDPPHPPQHACPAPGTHGAMPGQPWESSRCLLEEAAGTFPLPPGGAPSSASFVSPVEGGGGAGKGSGGGGGLLGLCRG